MSSIKPDKVIVLIGKRETGKSFLCKDLLYYHKNIPVGNVISPQKVLIVFMETLFLVFLYMMNIHQRLLKIYYSDKKQLKNKW